MDRRIARRIVLIAALIIIILIAGTVGFRVVEGYSYFDAFYMTLITITTVGYQEVHPLSRAGRVFNSFLIFFGVTALFLAVGFMTQTIIELELQNRFGRRRLRRAIMDLKDHYIVCGFGRVGRNAARELQRSGAKFVVIDRNPQRVEMAREAGMLALEADSTRDESLREAGVVRAKGFIAALATDADNVFVILSARTLNPTLNVVTRASEEDAEQKLRRAGADVVFSPFSMAGHRLAQALIHPQVVRLFEFGGRSTGAEIRTEQMRVAPSARLGLRTLGDLVPRESRVIVLAMGQAEGPMVFNPPPATTVSGGEIMIVMGEDQALRSLEGLLTQVA
jgi:voltage-gated potassium channel